MNLLSMTLCPKMEFSDRGMHTCAELARALLIASGVTKVPVGGGNEAC